MCDLVAARLVEDLLRTINEEKEKPISSIQKKMATLQSTAGAQAALRRTLLGRAAELHRLHHAAQVHLLIVAFAGQTHLPWAAFVGLPVAVLRAALQDPGLHQAQSISLCIDTMPGTAAQIIEALSAAPAAFQYLCFHQKPSGQTTTAPRSCTYISLRRLSYDKRASA